jgi:hypothetical protein
VNAQPSSLTRQISWQHAGVIALFVAAGVLIPGLGLPQAITGPLVNALLFLAAEVLGVGPAALLGMVTPLSALLYGVLPLPLLVMVPLIALGNGLLVAVYGALNWRRRAMGFVLASVAKALWLSACVALLTARPLQIAVGGARETISLPPALIQMMQWPQLLTALGGALLAWGMLRAFAVRSK